MICFDRDLDSQALWGHFHKSRNVLMLAPRRIGKTVLLNRMREECEEHGCRAILLDVEGFRDEKAFFRQMCAVIQEELGFGAAVMATLADKLRQFMKGPEAASGDWRHLLLNTEWRDFAHTLLSHLHHDRDGKSWLVLLDEIPVFTLSLLETHGLERAQDFLYTLRRFRQEFPHIRWVFTGSIGLDAVARRHGLEGALNDLEPYALKPFDEATAARFLTHIARGSDRCMEPEAASHTLRRLGWLSPYYLEKIAEEACQGVAKGHSVGIPDVDRALDGMLALDKRTYWSTWREHLDRNFPDPDRSHLFALLAALAKAPPEGLQRGSLQAALQFGEPVGDLRFRSYLDTLESDGYLVPAGDSTYRFRMGLLREWWRRYVVV